MKQIQMYRVIVGPNGSGVGDVIGVKTSYQAARRLGVLALEIYNTRGARHWMRVKGF